MNQSSSLQNHEDRSVTGVPRLRVSPEAEWIVRTTKCEKSERTLRHGGAKWLNRRGGGSKILCQCIFFRQP